MPTIVALLTCLKPVIPSVVRRQLAVIVLAMLTMTGRVTMSGMARWSGRGGSYGTIQRFFQTVVPWATLMGLVFRDHHHRPDSAYLLAGDETVVTKAGHHTQVAVGIFPSKAHAADGWVWGGSMAPRIAILAGGCSGIQVIKLAHGAEMVGDKDVLARDAARNVLAPHQTALWPVGKRKFICRQGKGV